MDNVAKKPMWIKFKEWAFYKPPIAGFTTLTYERTVDVDQQKIIEEAVARYCSICQLGFRTKGARNSHVAIKHKKKDDGNS